MRVVSQQAELHIVGTGKKVWEAVSTIGCSMGLGVGSQNPYKNAFQGVGTISNGSLQSAKSSHNKGNTNVGVVVQYTSCRRLLRIIGAAVIGCRARSSCGIST